MIQNIILDVDGTLWDTTEVVAKAWNEAIADNGISSVKTTAAKLKKLFGKPVNIIAKELFTDVDEESMRMELMDLCCLYEHKALEQTTDCLLFDGVASTLQELSGQGIRLFIVSNCQSGYIELFMQKNQLESIIQDKECFGDTGLSKGQNIVLVMRRQQLDPKETIYVGDTLGDAQASTEAGIPFAFAEYGFGSVENPTWRLSRFCEVKDLVQ